MPPAKGFKREYFPRVKEAREALRERAIELLESMLALSVQAAADKDYETAAKILLHLAEHMPEEDGERMLDVSVDKPKQVEGQTGPQIQIGIALGGVATKELPPAIIDVTPIEANDNKSSS